MAMNNTDPKRNIPAEKGEDNDPHLRDRDAAQPGASTISSTDHDEDNQNLTRTASESFRENSSGKKADKKFDE